MYMAIKRKRQPLERLITMTGVPAWLQPPKVDTTSLYTEWTWEEILRRVSEGESLASMCKDDPTMPPDVGRLTRWIMKNPERKQLYYEAQEIGTEYLVALAEKIAAGNDGLEDVQRSTLRVNTIKWIVGARNRGRYGDIKQVEQTVTVNISEAMQNAKQRVIELRKPVLIEQDVANG